MTYQYYVVKCTLRALICLYRFSELFNTKIVSIRRRGVQKVRRLTQLTTRYAHHILSLFNIVSCNWNAHGPVFLQSSDSVVEKLSSLFHPAICLAIQIRMANTVSDGVVQSRHFGWQPVLELTCDQMRCPGSKWLLFVSETERMVHVCVNHH